MLLDDRQQNVHSHERAGLGPHKETTDMTAKPTTFHVETHLDCARVILAQAADKARSVRRRRFLRNVERAVTEAIGMLARAE